MCFVVNNILVTFSATCSWRVPQNTCHLGGKQSGFSRISHTGGKLTLCDSLLLQYFKISRHGVAQWYLFLADNWSSPGARYSSVVEQHVHGAMDHWIDPSWWTHWAVFLSSQCSFWFNKGCGMCYHIIEPLMLLKRVAQFVGVVSFLSHLSGPLPYVHCHITVNKMCCISH